MIETRIAVVGAGIVGLAVAYHLTKVGIPVVVIDRDPEKADSASVINAGGIAVTEVFPAASPGIWRHVLGWITDPLGPLSIRPAHVIRLIPWLIRFAKSSQVSEVERISVAMAALNGPVYEDLVPMLQDVGLAHQLHRDGALSLYESQDGYRRDQAEWICKRLRGIEVQELTAEEARRMEPALGPQLHCALFTPQWSHIEDPRHLLRALREWLAARAITIRRADVRQVRRAGSRLTIELADGGTIAAEQVVIAAGAWSGILARQLGDRVLLESERGYNTTLPEPGIDVRRELIFAERKFVATPLSCGLRIGGAAEFGGLYAPANFKRSAALLELARRYLPDLRTEGGSVWAGHRPTTPDSLPVIGPSPHEPRVLYAFGHGHFGLTQAATTGRLITDLITHRHSTMDLAPYSIARFGAPKQIRDATTNPILR